MTSKIWMHFFSMVGAFAFMVSLLELTQDEWQRATYYILVAVFFMLLALKEKT